MRPGGFAATCFFLLSVRIPIYIYTYVCIHVYRCMWIMNEQTANANVYTCSSICIDIYIYMHICVYVTYIWGPSGCRGAIPKTVAAGV